LTLGRLWHDLAPLMGRTLGSTTDHPERGERVLLGRPSTLEATGAGDEPTPTAMRLASGALLGATTLTLEVPSQGKLAGVLLAGARVTVGAVTYTVAADAPATGTILAVTLTAGLQAGAADETPVTVHPEAVFTFEDCRVSRKVSRDLARQLQADLLASVFIPQKGAPTTPKLNNYLELEDGRVGRVAHVASGAGGWKVQMGA